MAESIADTREDTNRSHLRAPRPPAPVIAAALSGFVVGVFLTLLATGATHSGASATPVVPTSPPATMVPDRTLQARIVHLAAQQLGPMASDPKRSRLLSVVLEPPQGARVPLNAQRIYAGYRSVTIVFQLNDHPLGAGFRLLAARGDIFAVMKTLYASQLPIYDVTMEGCFPMSARDGVRCSAGPSSLRTALVVSMAYETASLIPWKKWNRAQEPRLWKLLSYRWVNAKFS